MFLTDSVYVGVDPTSGRKAFTYAALDSHLNLLALADAEMDSLMAFLGGYQSVTVAVNAPSRVNRGLVREKMEKQSLTSHQLRGVDMRMAEHELRERGIAVGGTGSREAMCPAWVQMGFALYERLGKMGFKKYPQDDGSRQWLETHPHACFCVLLEGSPLPKPTLEGRLQRELILYEAGVRIKDPMDFFEEITRHKLMRGILPLEMLYLPERLDALAAAYTAWLAVERPRDVTCIGHQEEGFITLPVATLKERY